MFYLFEITTLTDKEEPITATYRFDNLNDAKGTFHQKLGGAMKNEKYLKESLAVTDERFSVQCYEYYEKQVEPPVIPEETPAEGE